MKVVLPPADWIRADWIRAVWIRADWIRAVRVLAVAVLAASGTAAAADLTVWSSFTGPALDWLEAESDVFESAFDVEVELVGLDLGELRQRALLDAPEGGAADVLVGVPHDQVGELASAGVLADMGAYATSAYLADLSEPARRAFTFGDELIGLPLTVEGPALVLNEALVERTPASYDEMIATARELTADGTYGFLFDIGNFYFSYAWLRTHGGYVFGRTADGGLDPSDVGLADAGAIRGAEALRALRFEHALVPAGTDFAAADARFLAGDLAMIYTGPWSVPRYRDAGIDVAVTPVPPLADGTPWVGFVGVQGVLVNGFTDMETDAANYAKWLTRAEAQASLARRTGRVPASVSALERIDDPVLAGFGRALREAEPIPAVPEMGRVWGPMSAALSALLEAPATDPAAVLREAVDRIRGD